MMVLERRLQAIWQPTVNVPAGQSVDVFRAQGPGTLIFLQLADGGKGAIGYSIIDLALIPQNLLSSLFASAAAKFAAAQSRAFLFPFVEVQLMTIPQQAGATTGLPANTVFTAHATDWSGSFNTDAGGNVINEAYEWHKPLKFAGTLLLSITNFATAAVACSVRALIEA